MPGIKPDGSSPTSRSSRPPTAARCRPPACSRRTSRARHRCRSAGRTSADGRAAAVVLSSGNANAATGDQGRADALRMAALTGAGLGCDATDVLVCSTGLIGYFMPMAALESGIPQLTAALNGADAAADAILTTDTVRKEAVADGRRHARRSSAGWPRARRCSPRRWRRCSPSSPPTPRSNAGPLQAALDARGRRHLQPALRRRVHQHERHRARARQRRVRRAERESPASSPRSPTRSPRSAGRSPSRWRATPKGRRSSPGSPSAARRSYDDARRGRAPVAASQLVQCSLNGEDPYWGRVLSELGVSGATFDPEQVEISYNGVRRVPQRHRGRRPDGARRDDEGARDPHRVRPARRARARRRCCSPTCRTPTSTRTGARHERAVA